MKELIDKLLDKIMERQHNTQFSNNNLAQVILFGSAARNEATIYSDLDVVIVVDKQEHIRPAMRMLGGISGEINWPLDLLVVDLEQFDRKKVIGGVFHDANTHGIVLFDRAATKNGSSKS
ncbi:MAG: nucleotidyltransferase domain-containing protein [Oligoflexia bacterium]|nr:nucleotidyltransferase domain-containing protein [Oligoflexia bacterium]